MLKPSSHISKAVCKANQTLGLIRRSFMYLIAQLMKQLCTPLVRPHLEYGNVIWHPYQRKDTELFESIQHSVRMVPGLSKFSYEERHCIMKLPSLAYRRFRGDMIEVYKYLLGVYNIDCSDIVPYHRTTGIAMREHCLMLQKKECNSRIRANFFRYRAVNLWNSVPEDVVMATTVNCFKGRLCKFFESKCCCELWDDDNCGD